MSSSRFVSVRFLTLGFTLGAFAFAGCEGCGEDPPGTPPGPDLFSSFPEGNSVESDGGTRLPIKLTALDKDQNPEAAAITVAIKDGGGELFLSEAAAGAESIAGDPNEDGELLVEYVCEPNFAGQAHLTADNGKAEKIDITVRCIEPAGPIQISVDDSDCNDLQADGASRCTVNVTAVQQAATPIQLDGQMTVTVTSATVDAGSAVTTPDDAVLAAATGQNLSNSVLITLQDGVASFEVGSPTLDLQETLILELSTSRGNVTATQAATVKIGAFTNESSITFVEPAGNATEIGGNPITATVEARDVRGDLVAAGTEITFSINTTNDATLSSPTATTDATGRASVTVNTSAVPDDTTEDLTISASFLALSGSDEPLSTSVTVSLNPVGTLLLNASADPLEVHSDGATITERTSTITVTFTKDDAPVNPADVTLSIPVASRSRITFAGGGFTTLLDEGDFDSEGTADVDIVAVAGVAPGQVTIDVTGTDGIKNANPTAVTLEVLREPVLQSIVFISAAPAPIGVRGGTLPTSTVVEFELRDDQNSVMANVPVTFATPPTADPGIALLGSDVSGPDGKVQTVLSSGTIAAPVVVAVTATPANGPPLTAFSEPIAIIGGLPNFASSFMTCGDSFAHVEGEAFECQATLVDRFANLAGGQVVQFRAEGSGTTAFATSDDSGVAGAALVMDDGDTESGTSVPNWSYGFVPTASDVPALYAGCFDGTVTTGCDLLQLCEDEPFFCPLEPNCLDDALTARTILESNLTVSDLQGPVGRQSLATYVDTHRSCGFPVSCLVGGDFNDPARLGLISSVLVGDECTAAPGCFDYDGSECPADGILTVTASTRGEESFTDGNGNGVFDFIDSNDNGHQDTNEMPISGQTCDATLFPTVCRPERCQNGVCEVTFGSCNDDGDCVGGTAIDVPVDLPEPFLDKNDSCAFDDFSGSPRFLHTPSQRLKHSDLFNDVDNNNIFGFGSPATELNGLWDPDTEIFLSAHVLSVGAARIQVGAPCNVALGACPIEAQTPAGVIGMDPAGIPASISNGQTVTLRYRATDGNGNCPNPGFEDKLTAITLAGLKLAGDLSVTMQPLDCGYAFGINPVKSYCEDYGSLGSPVGTLQVTGDCETEPLQGTLDLKIGDENTAITIQCTP